MHYQEVLDFWFGPDTHSGLPAALYQKRWFSANPKTDALMTALFATSHQQACSGQLKPWTQQQPGQLALLLLFDQFSRNLYRGQAKSFSQDNKALDLAKVLIEQTLTPVHRSFVLMVFEHQEDNHYQQQAVTGFQTLLERSNDALKPMMKSFLRFALAHQRVISDFGRFPHRNVILNRTSTEAEIQYLKNHKGF